MNYTSTLTSKNQTTLPKAVVAALKAKPQTKLNFEVLEDNSVKITAKSATFLDLAGSFPKTRPKKPVTVEDMKEAVRQEAAKRFRKATP
ncbi:MAG: hypothetical protein KDK99_09530 [Verrucomicrobiales bacterium]|nr:hypothetical protein [Verrucomicrobiales bacterium]